MSGLERGRVDGMLRGALGSLAGLVAMGLFFKGIGRLSQGGGDGGDEEGATDQQGALDDISVVGRQSSEEEAATTAVGRIAYEAALGEQPDDETTGRLGEAVHWGYGVMAGCVYGALRPDAQAPDLTGGLGYGIGLWVLGDEVMVPLLGLSGGPTAHSLADHATALGAHLVYGVATAGATQALTAWV